MPDEAVAAALGEMNARIRAAGYRVRIEAVRDRLHLRATLPVDGDPTQRRQQRIALGLSAELACLPQAERRATTLGIELIEGRFHWLRWRASPEGSLGTPGRHRKAPPEAEALRALLQKRFSDWFPAHGANAQLRLVRRENLWKRQWTPALNKLPLNRPITERVLREVLESLPPSSAIRRNTSEVYSKIAKELGYNFKAIRDLGRGYSPVTSITPRSIPSDEAIEALWQSMSTGRTAAHWCWTFGMIATFGLRPHEVAEAELQPDGTCVISENTKTGTRVIWPVPTRWVEKFNLFNEARPDFAAREITRALNLSIRRAKRAPEVAAISLYNLRHAYAVRLLLNGVPADLGARLMGHSLRMHCSTYRRWVEASQLQALRGNFTL